MKVTDISGLDKAAILFQVLGDGLAITLFKELNEANLRRVRTRAKELSDAPFKIKKAVLEEFYFGFLAEKFKSSEDDGRKPFSFLIKLSDEQIAYLLLGEPPKIAAIVMAQLEPERQMNLYDRLDSEQRLDALMELGSGENMNLDVIASVAGELKEKSRYMPKGSEFERGSGEKLAGLLSRMNLAQADLFLEKLSQEDPELHKEVKRYYLTFDDIFQLPDGPLRDVLNAVELDDIAMALKGMDESIVEQALNVLSKKKQAMFEPVEEAVSKREVMDARRNIMAAVRKLQESGDINISEIVSGEMIE
ncbi:MAG: hypothetical protein IIA59_03040 [Candidatus Marinimicrobia bacterium]|nr:hypothetical protein [Candidatus Neomarinimicrobiota bacterium]